ncbi:polymorphic toxin-type HINT domain-containing protein [Streptomyces sp. NPDC003660]
MSSRGTGRVGDKVVATDPRTGKTSVQTATAKILGKGRKDLVRITLTAHDGSSAKTETTVTATAGHPFWVPTLREWIDAGHLEPGQWLQTSSGTWVQIGAVEAWTAQAAVYNLTVTQAHTYYVLAGAAPVLVHNCGGGVAGHSTACACASGAQPRMANGQMGASLNPRPQQAPSTHGNSRNSSAMNYLYVLEDASGDYLKTGITQNPAGRYSARNMAAMGAARMRVLTRGSRSNMLDLERWIVERWPGPFNRESHAGKKNLGL